MAQIAILLAQITSKIHLIFRQLQYLCSQILILIIMVKSREQLLLKLEEGSAYWIKILQRQQFTDEDQPGLQATVDLMCKLCPDFPKDSNVESNKEECLQEQLLSEGSTYWVKIIQRQELTQEENSQLQRIVDIMRKTCPNYPQDNKKGGVK
ncbi:MAG: hypothetical protein LBS16_07895 [Prevotellaceae bacterium]|jgi:hypothetical protein|nr:hypothetical protein [Prevotellaceae bacterium]